MQRVSIITTTRHNVGDDFVREGIVYLLQQVVGQLELQLIHKHLPVTARPACDWYHHAGVGEALTRVHPLLGLRGSRALDLLPLFPASDRVLNCDLLVQSGAPIYWTTPSGDCQNNEWWRPLIERRWLSRKHQAPFLNLAGGTCQHYHSDGSEFAAKPAVLDYVRKFHDLTVLTTVRDRLSLEVLRHAGRASPALPCTSIFAVNRLGIVPEAGQYVVLNYMRGGGHFEFGQPIDASAWERNFVSLVRRLARTEKCVLVCHDDKELAAARSLLPEISTFQSKDHQAYLRFYAGAKYGIMNRVHGAFALASLGKPAVVVGSDSRARMAGMIGLKDAFVNDATPEWLESQVDELSRRMADYPAEMQERKAGAAAQYIEAISRSLAGVK